MSSRYKFLAGFGALILLVGLSTGWKHFVTSRANPFSAIDYIEARNVYFAINPMHPDSVFPAGVDYSRVDTIVGISRYFKQTNLSIRKAFPVLQGLSWTKEEKFDFDRREDTLFLSVRFKELNLQLLSNPTEGAKELTVFPYPNPKIENFEFVYRNLIFLEHIITQGVPYQDAAISLSFVKAEDAETLVLVNASLM